MRGKKDRQPNMFYAFDVEDRIRADHPLRAIKKLVDEDLSHMGQLFNKAYSDTGRPSMPPERLLKAMLLQALYSIRSERQLVERIDTDLLLGADKGYDSGPFLLKLESWKGSGVAMAMIKPRRIARPGIKTPSRKCVLVRYWRMLAVCCQD